MQQTAYATGKVVKAFGNLLHVEFTGLIRQGEICLIKLGDLELSAEVIEINNNQAKVQVFEDTSEIKLDQEVNFSYHLLEAELGPGLLSSIFDGLQNPLVKVAEVSGLLLKRGVYLPALDREKKWGFKPTAKLKDVLERGDLIGEVQEGRFTHRIMLPFALMGKYTLTWLAKAGDYKIEEVIAKVTDDNGQEIPVALLQRWPVKAGLKEGSKIRPFEVMSTGQRIIDTQFPLMKGGTFCTPGPFGAGKTVLQHNLAKFSSVDIVIIAACGERAGEVVEVLQDFPKLIDEHTKEPLMNRTVIICNTSSMPVAAREASVYMAVTIGEYYRQMGLNILVLADSTSRWAQAMREISGRLEEIPGEEAFPAYLSSRIAAFYERAGVLRFDAETTGSLTIGGSVSPAGGNFEEPVTQATLAVVGAFLGLSRERASARRYPAIDPLISWSKYLPYATEYFESQSAGWKQRVDSAFYFLKKGDEIAKRMEVVGWEGTALEDMIIYLKAELFDISYLQQNAFDQVDAHCPAKRQCELFALIGEIFTARFKLDNHDEARSFFLNLQNEIKNLNFMPFESEPYQKKLAEIRSMIQAKAAK